jgi:hypothetical protein
LRPLRGSRARSTRMSSAIQRCQATRCEYAPRSKPLPLRGWRRNRHRNVRGWGFTAYLICSAARNARMSLVGQGLPFRLRGLHDRYSPDNCRLAATPKSAESGRFRTSAPQQTAACRDGVLRQDSVCLKPSGPRLRERGRRPAPLLCGRSDSLGFKLLICRERRRV